MTLRITATFRTCLLALGTTLVAIPPAVPAARAENGVEPIFAAARGYTA